MRDVQAPTSAELSGNKDWLGAITGRHEVRRRTAPSRGDPRAVGQEVLESPG